MRTHRFGIALLETIVILPVLLFVALGMVEFGQYFYVRDIFESAARDAARAAIPVAAQQADPTTAATRTLSQDNIPFSSCTMTITNPLTGQTISDVSTVLAGNAMSIRISATYYQLPNIYRPLNDMTGHGISNSKTIVSECTVIKE